MDWLMGLSFVLGIQFLEFKAVFMIEARCYLLRGCAGYMCGYKWRQSEVPEADTDSCCLALFVMYMEIILFCWMNLVSIETGYHRWCRCIDRTNTRFVVHVSSLSLWSLFHSRCISITLISHTNQQITEQIPRFLVSNVLFPVKSIQTNHWSTDETLLLMHSFIINFYWVASNIANLIEES